ncbi:MAG: TlpA family protein disulfide reductase [candidate division Zixibacteria bacterium]|nr:TlpA family protein disulfide reductase [candidate division Zixibacteria bacterium]
MFSIKFFKIYVLFLLFQFLTCKGGIDSKNSDSPYDFSLQDLKGKIHSLKEFKGKVVLLNFWATWCPPCKEDIAELVKIYGQYKDSGLEIIGISLDKKELGVVDSFAREMDIPYTILMGDETMIKNYGDFKGVPTTFLLNREGVIVKRYAGQITVETIKSDLNAWLKK